jgi:hypothetical protein
VFKVDLAGKHPTIGRIKLQLVELTKPAMEGPACNGAYAAGLPKWFGDKCTAARQGRQIQKPAQRHTALRVMRCHCSIPAKRIWPKSKDFSNQVRGSGTTGRP